MEVSTRAAPALAPTWTKTRAQALAAVPSAAAEWVPIALADGRDGKLWLFVPTRELLLALLLDENGQITATQELAPPLDLTLTPERGMSAGLLRSATDHPLGPVVPFTWLVTCQELAPPGRVEPPARSDSPGLSCEATEIFILAQDPEQAPTRIATWHAGAPEPTSSVYRTANGDGLFVPALLRIHKVDLTGRELWVSRPLNEAIRALLGEGWSPSPALDRAAVLADGSLLVALDSLGAGWSGPNQRLGLLRVGEQGGLALQAYELRGPGDTELSSGPRAVAVDREQRIVAAAPLQAGHLVILRIAGHQVERYHLLREEYAMLTITATASDPAGTFYLATPAGGRTAAEQDALLCRVPMNRTPDCFVIAALPSTMRAPAPGIVYGLSPLGLSRYDLPPP